jgi:hypothetical protein
LQQLPTLLLPMEQVLLVTALLLLLLLLVSVRLGQQQLRQRGQLAVAAAVATLGSSPQRPVS